MLLGIPFGFLSSVLRPRSLFVSIADLGVIEPDPGGLALMAPEPEIEVTDSDSSEFKE